MSSPTNLDLDFKDYTPTSPSSGERSTNNSTYHLAHHRNSIGTDEVHVKIPSSSDGGQASKQNLQGSTSFLNLLQNFKSGGPSSGATSGLSEDTIQEILWLTSRQKNKQQRSSIAASNHWGFGYLAQYFDVTTDDVLQRVVWSAIPCRKTGIDVDDLTDQELTTPLAGSGSGDESGDLIEQLGNKRRRYSYVERFIQSRPDLYGPLWVSVTLIFAVGLFSNIASFKSHRTKINQAVDVSNNSGTGDSIYLQEMRQMEEWHYSIDELNVMASLVMFYVTLLPTFLWFLFWFRGCTKYYTLTETICAYGYSLSIFIPLAALLMIQGTIFRYIVLVAASSISGLVLAMSFLPIVQSDPNKGGLLIILLIVFGGQLGLAYILHRMMLQ